MIPDVAVFDAAISDLSTRLDVYEAILSEQKYIAGNVSSPWFDDGHQW